MKSINMKKVYQKTISVTKKIKVNEALMGLQRTLNDINKSSGIKIDISTSNAILTFFSLNLLSITHDEKEYQEMFDGFLEGEIKENSKESEA